MTRAIGGPLIDAERAAFIAAGRTLVHARFRHAGRNARGVDCVGVLIVAMKAVGRNVVDVASYGREPHEDLLRRTLVANLGEPVDRESMRAGDVALMRFIGEPSHAGLLADYPHGGLSLIHGYAVVRKVVEHRLDDDWRGRILEVYRP